MNAGENFQREMDIDCLEEKDNFFVIYMDDITIYSKYERDHTNHFENLFLKCRRYGISLNPRKSKFSMKEGKLLGHIISKDGIRIDPNIVKYILKVEVPRNKREIQSFIGQVNFSRCFIPSFAKNLRNVTNMLRKDCEIKWTIEAKKYFNDIKKAIIEAPVLVNLEFSKYFIAFCFAFEHTRNIVLLQKNQ